MEHPIEIDNTEGLRVNVSFSQSWLTARSDVKSSVDEKILEKKIVQ
jgi:hypothetical protein